MLFLDLLRCNKKFMDKNKLVYFYNVYLVFKYIIQRFDIFHMLNIVEHLALSHNFGDSQKLSANIIYYYYVV